MLNKCFRTQKFQRTSQLLDCSGKVNAFFLTYKLLMLFFKNLHRNPACHSKKTYYQS